MLPNSFIKIHQSYVINIKRIAKYKISEVEFERIYV